MPRAWWPSPAGCDETIAHMSGSSAPLPSEDAWRREIDDVGPRVAIVIPVFNTAEAFLRQAADSAVRQTMGVDVILVDDGSVNPDTIRTLEDLTSEFKVRVVRHERNRGVAAAINSGFKATRAPYVLAMGSDDIVEATYAELAADILDGRPEVSIVTTDIQRFGASNSVDVATGAPNGVQDMLFHNVVSGASVCRRSDWEAVGGYAPLRWGEDYEFWLRVLARGGICVRLDTIQYRYRIHRGQATQTLTADEKLADRLDIVLRNKHIWAEHIDVVMTRLWLQEDSLAYFKRRYGPINSFKSRIVTSARSARGHLHRVAPWHR